MQPRTLGNRILVVSGLLLFFALAVDTAVSKTPTVDESVHVTRGYTLWQTDDLRLQTKPPLSHWLIGSLLFLEPDLTQITELAHWDSAERVLLSRELIWQSDLNIARLFLLARLPIIFLGLFLGTMLVRWAGELLPRSGQMTLLILFAFSPNLLASAALATTDFTATVTYGASIYTLWWYWRRPTKWRWVLASLCLGLALATKITAFLLLPVTLLLCYSEWRKGRDWWRPAALWLTMLPLAFLILWGAYHFEIGEVAYLPFPVPAATYISNFNEVQGYISSGRQSSLLGERSSEGWYHYFVVAFLAKTPIPTLLLSAFAALVAIRRRLGHQIAYLLLPSTSLFMVASLSRLNIGYRHILPLLPFVLLLAAGTVPIILERRRGKLLVPLFLIWYTGSGLRQHPHHLAYFNEFVGGSGQGYRYLGDSNLDWGQDLKLLAEFVQQSGDRTVYYSYFGASDPFYYGLAPSLSFNSEGEPLDFAPANPRPGLYAISANHLQGMVLSMSDTFDWFRRHEPSDQLGYSVLIYDVPPAPSGHWVAHCLDPTPALEDQSHVSRLLDQTQLRHVYFDCRDSWVFPDQGAAGWYILPQREAWPVAQRFEDAFSVVYSQSASSRAPAHDIVFWDGQTELHSWLANADQQAFLAGGGSLDLPLLFGETVQLMAHQLEGSTWFTMWQAQAQTDVPLSIAAHLYSGEPNPAIFDGLGYTAVQWLPGDLFLQQYQNAQLSQSDYLETGIYNFHTGERLAFPVDDQSGTLVRIFPPD